MNNPVIKKVPIAEIKLNPKNPRQISDKDMARLVKSLKDFPEMLKLREIVVDEKMVILGGNMRLLALQQLGVKECTIKIVKDLTPKQKKEFTIKDNACFGDWDMDILSTWDTELLPEWGVKTMKEWTPPDIAENKENKKKKDEPVKPNIIICPECGHEISILKEH